MVCLKFVFIFLFGSCLCLVAQARVDVKKTKRIVFPSNVSEPLLSEESSRRILPQKIEPGESGSSVISEMIDNSFSLWWEKSAIKTTTVGQIAEQVDKKLKTEVNLGTSEDQKIEHKISVKVLAVQTLAKIEYRGWVRAAVNYDARASRAEAEVLENLSANQDLKLSHSMKSGEQTSQLSLLWNW